VAVSVVHDSKSTDLILKLVNKLPVAVNARVDLEGIGPIPSSAIRTVLTGTPVDKKARPEVDSLAVSQNFPCSLPAYSFTVLRIRKNQPDRNH
jgi:alpha-L-arabinofuranosidase